MFTQHNRTANYLITAANLSLATFKKKTISPETFSATALPRLSKLSRRLEKCVPKNGNVSSKSLVPQEHDSSVSKWLLVATIKTDNDLQF